MKNLMIIFMMFLGACASKKGTDSREKTQKTPEEITKEWQEKNKVCSSDYDCSFKQKIQFNGDSFTVFAPTGENKEFLEGISKAFEGEFPEGTYTRVIQEIEAETKEYFRRLGVSSELTVFMNGDNKLVCQDFEHSSVECVLNNKSYVVMHFKATRIDGAPIEVGVMFGKIFDNQ